FEVDRRAVVAEGEAGDEDVREPVAGDELHDALAAAIGAWADLQPEHADRPDALRVVPVGGPLEFEGGDRRPVRPGLAAAYEVVDRLGVGGGVYGDIDVLYHMVHVPGGTRPAQGRPGDATGEAPRSGRR